MTDAHVTIPDLLRHSASRCGDQPAIATISEGHLRWHTWQELATDIQSMADGLAKSGVGQGERVAQYAPNSYEWILADLAILSLGAVHVPLHASLIPRQALELFERADARLLIVDEPEQLENGLSGRITTHGALRSTSRTLHDLSDRSVEPDSLATILFTSGTTGKPRGVMLSHRNLVCNAIATGKAVGASSEETRLCFLPLSHIYARTCDLYSWLHRGTRLVLAESRDTIIRDCQLAEPTVINGVPYFYQKVADELHAAGKTTEPGVVQKLLGGNLKRCFCGGAAIAPAVEKLFETQGLPILSGYGLTEAAPVVTATSPTNYQPGSVGKPLANLQVELARDGEVLVQGPSVMTGYWRDEQATAEALADEWLHTGDLGEFAPSGNLRIVGRKKELIVLSTGKNVAPTSIEQRLSSSPLIEHVCVFGEGHKCLVALVVPNPEMLRREIRERRLWVWSKRRAVTHPVIRKLYREEIDRLLEGTGHENQVGPFTILTRNFSKEAGELTPKMSLCREKIANSFAAQLDHLLAGLSAQ